MTLQKKLDEYKAQFESGGPRRNARRPYMRNHSSGSRKERLRRCETAFPRTVAHFLSSIQ